jgi:hypothetical protein
LLGSCGYFHSILYRLLSILQWWVHVSSWVMSLSKKAWVRYHSDPDFIVRCQSTFAYATFSVVLGSILHKLYETQSVLWMNFYAEPLQICKWFATSSVVCPIETCLVHV